MSWEHLEKNPPWFVRIMARRKVRAKVVVALSDEELAIASGIPVARLKAIYNQRNWGSVTLREIQAFCQACGFDPFSCADRNRVYAYRAAIKEGRCEGFAYLKKSPWWTSTFQPLILRMKEVVAHGT
jgi:hypothetical protein